MLKAKNAYFICIKAKIDLSPKYRGFKSEVFRFLT